MHPTSTLQHHRRRRRRRRRQQQQQQLSYIRSDCSVGVSTVIGLIVSALQMRRTKRVIATRRRPPFSPAHPQHSAASAAAASACN